MNAAAHTRRVAPGRFDHHHLRSRNIKCSTEAAEVGRILQAYIKVEVAVPDANVRRRVVIAQYYKRARWDAAPKRIVSKLVLPAAVAAHAGGKILDDHSPKIQIILNY